MASLTRYTVTSTVYCMTTEPVTPTVSRPTYIQHVALGKLINGIRYGHPIAPRTTKVLEREGWARNGKVTDAGLAAYQNGTAQ